MAAAAFLLLATTVVAAQRQEPPPVFRAGAYDVVVDVVVTDLDGRPVRGLGVEDFVVEEDGRPVELRHVQIVDAAAILSSTSGTSPPPLAVAGDRRVSEVGVAPAEVPTIAYLLDMVGLGYWERRRFSKGWSEFLSTSPPRGVAVAVYMIEALGTLRELLPPTPTQEALADLFEILRRSSYYGLAGEPAAGPIDGELPADGPYLFERESEDSRRLSAGSRFDLLGELVRELAGRTGRKTIVWVSEGVPPNIWNSELILHLARQANTAGVSIYGLDPTLVTKRYQQAAYTRIQSREGPADPLQRGDLFDRRVLKFDGTRDALVDLSRRTGGNAFVYRTDVAGALEEVHRDSGCFYLITYRNPEPVGDREYHDIDVRVRGRDVRVRARPGYYDRYPTEIEPVGAGVTARRSPHGIGARAGTGPTGRCRACRRRPR